MSNEFAGLEIPVDKPQRMMLVHPTSRQPLRDPDGNEAYIDLFSANSEAARKHNRAIQRRRLAMRGRGRIAPEELESEAIELLALLTSGWRLVALDGQPLDVKFSIEAARRLYAAPNLAWVREQVDEFAADRGKLRDGLVAELIEWAEHEFRLGRRAADGATEGDHAESAARQWEALGRKPKRVATPDEPAFPLELDYLWDWFDLLSAGLAVNGMAPPVVTWTDIAAWQSAMDIGPIEPWEAATLVQLGMLRASVISERGSATGRSSAK